MAKILIVAATLPEMEPLLFHLNPEDISGDKLKYFRVGKLEVDVLITGAGMAATAFQLGKVLSKDYNFAINAGISGSFKKDIVIGEVVHVTAQCFADLGAEDGGDFLSLIDLKLRDKNEFPFDGEWMKNPSKFNSVPLSGLRTVKGISVNKVHGSDRSIQQVVQRLNPDVESMEGAAFFYTCLHENIPFSEVRAVSNYVEKRNREAWNIPLAVENLNKKVMEILNSLEFKF